MSTWCLKTEPDTFSWDDLVRDKTAVWDGVRNYTARIHLRAMKKGDVCFIYHSVGPKEIVGIAEVTKEPYPAPTDDDPKKPWVAVDIKPKKKLKAAVTLETLKGHKVLKGMQLVKMSRLSVSPVSPKEEAAILELAK